MAPGTHTHPDTTTYRTLIAADVPDAIRLWRESPGVGLSSADEPEELRAFLAKNDGLCWAAAVDGRLVGTVLCGSDGRRGYIYHLAVADRCRRMGIGRSLVARVLESARNAGLSRCHAMVFADNAEGRRFWSDVGWRLRDDLVVFSRDGEHDGNESLTRPG